jgi:uncharacterized protein (DUF1697 family)
MNYAAFLRGIMPGVPNKSNEALRGAFEKLGFENVRSFISSGNIMFESSEKDTLKLEEKIEKGLKDILDLESATLVRSKEDLEKFVTDHLFQKEKHSPKTYLFVTFLKHSVSPKELEGIPHIKYDKNLHAISAIIDMSEGKAPIYMLDAEKKFGKDITSRTFNTVQRVTAKL